MARVKMYTFWGCYLTSLEDMLFSKWLENNPQIPRPNTITAEQRHEMLKNWLDNHRNNKKSKKH